MEEIEVLEGIEQALSETIKELVKQRIYLRKVIALKTVTKKINDIERRKNE